MEDKPRYSRVSDILHLIFLMSSKIEGVSIKDIMDEFNISRRTAERMRDSILCILPQVDEIESSDRQKRWGFVDFSVNELISFTAEEIAAIEKLKNNYDNATNADLKQICTKLQVLVRKKKDIRDSVSLLLQSEGIAITQHPSYKVDLSVLSIVREGIKTNKKLKATYNGKHKLLSPLGIIFGTKVYLVAKEEDKGQEPYHYMLHVLKDVELTEETFDKKNFNLKKFSEKSFGIYQGEVFDVKLEFKKDVAQDVLSYNFHPSQKIKIQENGTVLVSFKASGDRHIMWHLFTWGTNVKILSPKSLKKEYVKYLQDVLNEVV